ncbi:MAG: nitroreductase family protein [Candidatus Bathyarchaeia archaeon]
MDFSEVIAKRRSIRKFKEDSVSDEALSRVLEAGRWAPSAGNTQPWRFIVVTDPEVRQRIAAVCTESSKKAWSRFTPERAKYLAQRGGSWDKSSMGRIPALVVVCYEVLERMREEFVLGSAWAAIENMLLAATAEGLASCIYTYYDLEEEQKLKEILRVPNKYRIAAMIQLGFSCVEPPLPSRKTLKEIVSYQHF